jgi:hypothetical protein
MIIPAIHGPAVFITSGSGAMKQINQMALLHGPRYYTIHFARRKTFSLIFDLLTFIVYRVDILQTGIQLLSLDPFALSGGVAGEKAR